jgi:hypothetical protein
LPVKLSDVNEYKDFNQVRVKIMAVTNVKKINKPIGGLPLNTTVCSWLNDFVSFLVHIPAKIFASGGFGLFTV